MKIALPKQLEIRTVAPLISDIIDKSKKDVVELDFSNIRFARPAGAIYLAFWLRHLINSGNKNLIVPKPSGLITIVQSYLSHIGFWRYFDDGCDMTSAPPKSRGKYLPFTPINFPTLNDTLDSTKAHRAIERQSRELARIITRIDENWDGLNRLLSYSLRETIRNVLEHAATDTCVVFGQNWANDVSEIVIADTGIGIAKSLRSAFTVTNGQAALKLALRPGISSKLTDSNGNEWDEWDNAGFGLYMLSEIGRRLGQFLLMSDGHFVQQVRDSRLFGRAVQPPGTLVAMKFEKISSADFRSLIEEIRLKGENVISSQGRKSTRID